MPPQWVWKPSRSRPLRQRISRRLESWTKRISLINLIISFVPWVKMICHCYLLEIVFLLHRSSCAVLQVLMASHHGYAMWVVIVYQFINNAQSRTRTTDKKQLLWLCVSKKATTYAGVGGDCEAARFFLSNFSHRQICERHLLEANLPSSIWMGEGSCMLQLHGAKTYDEWPFWCEFQPDRNCTFHLLPINSFMLFLCNLARW